MGYGRTYVNQESGSKSYICFSGSSIAIRCQALFIMIASQPLCHFDALYFKYLPMKQILFFCLLVSFSASAQFEKKWETLLRFEKDGSIRSAYGLANDIFEKSRRTHNEPQLIKSFFYKAKFMMVLDPDAQTKILALLDGEKERVSIPTAALLDLMYANCLSDYLNSNNRLYNNKDSDSLSTDFKLWTRSGFRKAITKRMEHALKHKENLKATTLEKYEPVFDFLNIDEFKKVTLYEYLLLQQIEFVKKETMYDYAVMDNPSLFAESTVFCKTDFAGSNDTKKIIGLYQNLERFRPLGSYRFERMAYFSQRGGNQNIYLKALDNWTKQKPETRLLQKLLYQKASFYMRNADAVKFPDYNIQAEKRADSILQTGQKSNTYWQARELKDRLHMKTINIKLPEVVYEGEKARLWVEYGNIDSLKVTFHKIGNKDFTYLLKIPSAADSLVNLPRNRIQATLNYALTSKNDYFTHSTELLLPSLPIGQYVMKYEAKDTKLENSTTYKLLTVSNFALLAKRMNQLEYEQVLNRKTGLPESSVTLIGELGKAMTDRDGEAAIAYKTRQEQPLTLFRESDTLTVARDYIRTTSINPEENDDYTAKTFFYLDRPIFRPGQKVYYKGITLQKRNGELSVAPNITQKITVEDAGNNEIKSFEVTTNAYGSFSGSFDLPANGLTGNYTLSSDEPDWAERKPPYKAREAQPFWDDVYFETSELDFKVEAYKRPKFEVIFDEIPGSPKIGEPVTVTGKIRAYDGSMMSNSNVKYTVIRNSRYRYSGSENNKVSFIADTLTTSDTNGKFSFSFVLKDSEDEIKTEKKMESYQISASVTDISGESHEASLNFNAGNYVLKNTISIPSEVTSSKPGQIIFNVTNLNYKAIPATGTVSLYKTGAFSGKFRPRQFPKPDMPVISDPDFEKWFPFENNQDFIRDSNDDDDDDGGVNEKDSLVTTLPVNTLKSGSLSTAFMKSWSSGYYKAVFKATDKEGNVAENEVKFLFQQDADQFNVSKWLTIKQLNENPVKDGFVKFRIASPVDGLFVHISADYNNSAFYKTASALQNHALIFKVPLNKNQQNAIGVNFECFYDNYFFTANTIVPLEKEIAKIDFESGTFRSKIAPGTEQQWSFKLKGNSSVQAEVLASMYDASLDSFGASDWILPVINDNNYYSNLFTRNALGMEQNSFSIYGLNRYTPDFEYRNEDITMLWFGFNFNGDKMSNEAYLKQLARKAPLPPGGWMISGIVKDEEGLPLPGVNVIVTGTERGTSTDLDGFYEIYATKNEKLEFSFVGMSSSSIEAKFYLNDITLKSESLPTVEIISNGYNRTKTKRALSGAIMNVQYNSTPKQFFIDSLQGTAPGLTVLSSSDSTGSGRIGVLIRGLGGVTEKSNPLYIIDGVLSTAEQLRNMNQNDIEGITILKDAAATSLYGNRGSNGVLIVSTKAAIKELKTVKTRSNLSETAFFFPALHTDEKGNLSFSFTSPEALTEWKLRLLGHNKSGSSAYLQKLITTQKELAITPNFPRFVREKDTLTVRARISNLSLQPVTGKAMLQLFDANGMKEINAISLNIENTKDFNVGALASVAVSWKIAIPEGISGLQYKVVAKSGNFSDGEENIIPVLSNNILVTESIPLWVREKSKRTYTFDEFAAKSAAGLKQHQMTIDYSTNPAWTAIAALPYLMEFEHECAEQTFARYYANTLAAFIFRKNPKIATVIASWNKENDPAERNEQLKTITMAETPWANDLKTLTQKRQQTAILLDTTRTNKEAEKLLGRITGLQLQSGSFAWFSGGHENTYITTHIIAGFGHLEKMGVNMGAKEKSIIDKAIVYLDKQFMERKGMSAAFVDLNYLRARSFYVKKNMLPPAVKKVIDLQLPQIAKNWTDYSLSDKATAALVLFRFGDKATAQKILQSFRETAALNEDDGMYWLENKPGWHWNDSPIEIQALLIEAFMEIDADKTAADAMKVWLLKKRQRSNWPTTKSTTEAIYALLMNGSDWTESTDNTVFKIGDEKILSSKLKENDGTGNVHLEWNNKEIQPGMQTLTIENKSNVPGYGGFYWQYFQDINKIKALAAGELSVKKEFYIRSGDKMLPLSGPLKVGDKVTVRLTITAKSDFEFVHVKDARSSCFEPLDIHSGYEWGNGNGFYKSVRDTASHFFFDRLSTGTTHIEYEVFVNNSGVFSDAPVTIECMYAPEFSAHGNGRKVQSLD